MADKNKKKTDTIDDTVETNVRSKKFWKFWVVMVAINIGLLVVIGRLLYIQTINADYYLERAKRQQQSKIALAPERGNIYDRNGNVLASNLKSVSIAVDPKVLKNKEDIAKIIEKNLGIDSKRILDKINSANGEFLWIVRRVMPDKVAELRKIKDRGLLLIDEPTRYYNYSSIGAQLIGCTSIDNRGLGGLELQYDSLLKGHPGYIIMYKDARGNLRPAVNLPAIDPINGSDIHLTIDIELQKIVEFELMQGVINAQAVAGTVVALNPNTGELLAVASYPGYNPNSTATYSADGMRNRAIADAYEPGSTFKSITASAGIEEKVAKPNDIFNGFGGRIQLANVTIRDEHPLGMATFEQGFRYSSNIILSQVAMKLPDQKFYKYIRDFGFGLPSHINLPGEISGRIPKFNNMNAIDKRYIGFGYGILVTPMQLVAAYSAIANDGILMKPYVVSGIVKNGDTIRQFSPEKIRKTISKETAKTVTKLLCAVVDSGTGKLAHLQDLKIAGKTGTTQKMVSGSYSKSNYYASFVGYYPADNPQICLLVCLDRPQNSYYGGAVAAPVFKNIALRWASISPEILEEQGIKRNRHNANTVYVPELTGLSIDDARLILSELDLKLSTTLTSGIIVSQMPRSGSRIVRGSTILTKINYSNDSDTSKISNMSVTLPDASGLTLRRAISILHNAGYRARIVGSGTVKEQRWEVTAAGERLCILICK